MPKYFAPSFKVEINGSALSADISKYIQQVEVVSQQDSMDSFSFTLANPYPKMRWTKDEKDAKLFSIGNAVIIEIGYIDQEQYRFVGDITQVSAQFPEGGTPTLNVQGHTLLHRLSRRRLTRTFQDRTDKQIVEEIARDYGLTPQAEETNTVYPHIIQQNQTDLQFLMERGERICFELRVEDKSLIFRPIQECPPPVEVLEWGKNLRNFRPTMNARGQVNNVRVRGYNPMEKQEIISEFAGSGSNGQSGPEIAEQAFGNGEEELVDSPVSSQEEADQMAEAIYNERARGFLTGSGATIGLPSLRAGQAIEINGLGQFSGTYLLTQVTHTVGSSGYTTSFNGERCSQ